MNSPLEQFEILRIIPITIIGYDISITNSALFSLIAILSMVSIVWMSTHRATIVPNKWQSGVEIIYEFVLNTVTDNIGKKGLRYFPLVFALFSFILMCNLIGMIPYSFTVTSHAIITFGIGFSLFIGITILGFLNHGIHFFSLLLPEGSPMGLAPLIVGIELLSYFSKPLSLSIRLFANMMAGHTLLKIIAGFGWTMFGLGGMFYIFGFIPVILLFALVGLEIGIAAIQAYVFSLLVCMYLNDSIHLH
jgi:ATP synthase subunit 6